MIRAGAALFLLALFAGCAGQLTPATPSRTAAQTLATVPTPRPNQFNVYFEHRQSSLTPEAAQVVASLAELIRSRGARQVDVTGHSDSVMAGQAAVTLSQARANVVTEALVRGGVDRAKIRTGARGAMTPAVLAATGVREPVNRRVEVDLLF